MEDEKDRKAQPCGVKRSASEIEGGEAKHFRQLCQSDNTNQDHDVNDCVWNYSLLPDHIIVYILSCLQLHDRHQSALACKSWSNAFNSPYLWRNFTFYFYTPKQAKFLRCLDKYGKLLERVQIELDQSDSGNRENASEVIRRLSELQERRLTHLKVYFAGENPLFYAGKEFIDALYALFGPVKDGSVLVKELLSIDLSAMPITLEGELFSCLSANHSYIQHLNIQNCVLVCKVSPTCMLRVVQRCRQLRSLCIMMCSISEEVLLALTEDDRAPLGHLSLKADREEKYAKDLSSEVWHSLATRLPDLRVTLAFDHTCPLPKVSEVMKPEIPVSELKLETFTYIYDEVRMASGYYKNTLRKMVLNTPMSRNSPEFNSALVELASECKLLEELHVQCVLKEDTVKTILGLHPEMRDRGTYTLKWNQAPTPWIAGAGALPIQLK